MIQNISFTALVTVIIISILIGQVKSDVEPIPGLSAQEIQQVRSKLEKFAGPECAIQFPKDIEELIICTSNHLPKKRPKQDEGDEGGDEADPGLIQNLFGETPSVSQALGLITEAFTGLNSVVNQTSGQPSLQHWLFNGVSNLFGTVTGVKIPPTPPAYFPVPPARPGANNQYRPNSLSQGQRPRTPAPRRTTLKPKTQPPTVQLSPNFSVQYLGSASGGTESGQFFPAPPQRPTPTLAPVSTKVSSGTTVATAIKAKTKSTTKTPFLAVTEGPVKASTVSSNLEETTVDWVDSHRQAATGEAGGFHLNLLSAFSKLKTTTVRTAAAAAAGVDAEENEEEGRGTGNGNEASDIQQLLGKPSTTSLPSTLPTVPIASSSHHSALFHALKEAAANAAEKEPLLGSKLPFPVGIQEPVKVAIKASTAKPAVVEIEEEVEEEDPIIVTYKPLSLEVQKRPIATFHPLPPAFEPERQPIAPTFRPFPQEAKPETQRQPVATFRPVPPRPLPEVQRQPIVTYRPLPPAPVKQIHAPTIPSTSTTPIPERLVTESSVVVNPPDSQTSSHSKGPVIVNNVLYPDLEAALSATRTSTSSTSKPRRRRRTTTTTTTTTPTPSPFPDPDYYEEEQESTTKARSTLPPFRFYS